VADGMGGHAGGRRASALAVETLTHYVLNTMPWFFRLQEGLMDLDGELRAALEQCQKRIEEAAAVDPQRQKMGTTLTMAYLLWPTLYVVHAGDSRCYLLRGNRLEQVTTDHTLAQQMVERGALRPDEAEGSRWSHVLYNCIGGGSHELNPDVCKATLHAGDTLLLCTDGLSKVVSETAIREVLGRNLSAGEACRQLVELANAAGGPDNITVVVARFLDAEQAAAQAMHQTAAAEPTEQTQGNGEAHPAVELVAETAGQT